MTLAQLEERVAALEQVKERLTALEQAVERLQSLGNGGSNASSTTSEGRKEQDEENLIRAVEKSRQEAARAEEQKEEDEEDLIPGTEYDLVVTVPPQESFHIQGRIVSIETPPAELGLSDEEWALFGSEDEDE